MKTNVILAALLVSAMSGLAFGQAAEKIVPETAKAATEAVRAAQQVGNGAGTSAAAAAALFGKAGAAAANQDLFGANSTAVNQNEHLVLKDQANKGQAVLGASCPSNGNLGQVISGSEIEELNAAIADGTTVSTCFTSKFDAATLPAALHEVLQFRRANKGAALATLTTDQLERADEAAITSVKKDLGTTFADAGDRVGQLCELGCTLSKTACGQTSQAASTLSRQD